MTAPLVSVLMPEGRKTARLHGRLTRVGGVPISAEISFSEIAHFSEKDIVIGEGDETTLARSYRAAPVVRYTLVPVHYVEPMNDEARALMNDPGPKHKEVG